MRDASQKAARRESKIGEADAHRGEKADGRHRGLTPSAALKLAQTISIQIIISKYLNTSLQLLSTTTSGYIPQRSTSKLQVTSAACLQREKRDSTLRSCPENVLQILTPHVVRPQSYSSQLSRVWTKHSPPAVPGQDLPSSWEGKASRPWIGP